ncbi:putative splicing factor 3A subunit 1-like isoform X1 [Capsicum annuum]|nr:putative splicing factor 3A subunit 1-like isoform X1 [Capsicum annuum]
MQVNVPRCLFGKESLGEIAIFACGCNSQGKILSSAELYNSETGTWRTLRSMNKPCKVFCCIHGWKVLRDRRHWTEIPNLSPVRPNLRNGIPATSAAPPLVAVESNQFTLLTMLKCRLGSMKSITNNGFIEVNSWYLVKDLKNGTCPAKSNQLSLQRTIDYLQQLQLAGDTEDVAAFGKSIVVDKATEVRSRPSTARVRVIPDLMDKHPDHIQLQSVDKVTSRIIVEFEEVTKRNVPGDLLEVPMEEFEGDLGVDIFDEEDEDEVLNECFAKVARDGDLSPRQQRKGFKKKKTHERKYSWVGKVSEEVILRQLPMRVAKQKDTRFNYIKKIQ